MKRMLTSGVFAPKNELSRYAFNIFQTEKLLQRFEFQQELKKSGIWLTPDEIKARASHTLKCLLDCNLIQNGLIVSGIKEQILEQV